MDEFVQVPSGTEEDGIELGTASEVTTPPAALGDDVSPPRLLDLSSTFVRRLGRQPKVDSEPQQSPDFKGGSGPHETGPANHASFNSSPPSLPKVR